ncbi:MAG: hypothetical protein AB4426_29955 [Xenococcaceae cyanobacterium]
MGRKAKLKKIRREAIAQSGASSQSQNQTDSDPNKFVQQLERQGYQLGQIERSPELPEQRRKPQV